MSQTPGGPTGWSRARRPVWMTVVVIAIVYAPLAIQYAWKDFFGSIPRLQSTAAASVVSHDFAFGPGSVEVSQGAAYHDARIALLIHTSFAGLALLACLIQFSSRIRSRHPQFHRRLGRLSLGSVAISMIGAAVLLIQAPPNPAYLGGIASTVQLVALNLSTIGAATLAFLAIRGGDVKTHQSWMAYLLAMLLSAPLLRLSWVVFGNTLSWATELISLRLGTIVLVLLIPAGAIGYRALVLPPDETRSTARPGWPPRTYATFACLGVAGSVMAALRIDQLNTGHDTAWTLVQILPLITLAAWFGLALLNTTNDVAHRDWATYFAAACLAPTSLNLGWTVAGFFLSSPEAFLTAAMSATPLPLVAAYFLIVTGNSTWWRRRRPTTHIESLAPARMSEFAASG